MMLKVHILLCFCLAFLSALPLQSQFKRSVKLRKIGEKGRIVGGQPATAAQYPFTASIRKSTTSGTYFCGGTVISDLWLLTAGTCVDAAVVFTVHLGSIYIDGSDPNVKIVSTAEYLIAENYNILTLEGDIGLIKLREPLEFNDFFYPIHYVRASEIDPYYNVIVVGWGSTSDANDDLSPELLWAWLYTIGSEECQETYGIDTIHDSMVCTVGNYNEGACIGDIGGPLVQIRSILDDYILTGISSFISGNGCESLDPSGFTKVAFYIDWIVENTGADLNIHNRTLNVET